MQGYLRNRWIFTLKSQGTIRHRTLRGDTELATSAQMTPIDASSPSSSARDSFFSSDRDAGNTHLS